MQAGWPPCEAARRAHPASHRSRPPRGAGATAPARTAELVALRDARSPSRPSPGPRTTRHTHPIGEGRTSHIPMPLGRPALACPFGSPSLPKLRSLQCEHILRNPDPPPRPSMHTATDAARQQSREPGITADLTAAAGILGIGRTRHIPSGERRNFSCHCGANWPQLPCRRRADYRLPRPARRAWWLILPLRPKRSVHNRRPHQTLRIAEGANPLHPEKDHSCRRRRRRRRCAVANDPANHRPEPPDIEKVLRLLRDPKVFVYALAAAKSDSVRRPDRPRPRLRRRPALPVSSTNSGCARKRATRGRNLASCALSPTAAASTRRSSPTRSRRSLKPPDCRPRACTTCATPPRSSHWHPVRSQL